MEEQTPIQGSKRWITIAAMLGALMAVIDISIVNVALSDIRASFGTPLDQIAWVSPGYAMANVTVIPLSGWFQRRFGFRNYYAGSMLVFTAASALCAFAWNLPSLVLFRILQGIGGAFLFANAAAIVTDAFPREQLGLAMGTNTMVAAVGLVIGPVLGGALVAISWHWVFWFNVPFALAGSLWAWLILLLLPAAGTLLASTAARLTVLRALHRIL